MRPADVARRGEAYLQRHGVASARAEAEALMAHVLGIGRAQVYARDEGLSSAEARSYGRALCRRCTGTPLQHVTGSVGFRRMVLEVRPGVFVPRPETEVTVDVALEAIAVVEHPRVVDVGTGSGAIALAIAHERPDATVWATDRSPEAVALASDNAGRLGIRVTVAEGDLLDPVPPDERGRIDLVVSNPPYVPAARADRLPLEVRAEPALALFGDVGTARRILEAAAGVLRPNGAAVVEIEEGTATDVERAAREAGYVRTAVTRDLAGRDRVVSGRRP